MTSQLGESKIRAIPDGFVVQPGTCFVTGHDFSRADNANKINVGL
jgi:hypothetical protein